MTIPALRIAIVGSGPAGLYAAGHLLDNRDHSVEVDFFERLPTPWGLVRSGVAPDHDDKKKITDRLFDFTLRDPRVQFFGNVTVGKDVQVVELTQWYHAVIFAHGAGDHNAIGIPGEDLEGVWGARDFVQFYNAHPDQADLRFDLSHPRAIIVGNGNVALDIARILTADIAVLEKTDIAQPALDVLRASKIREVVIMGRRDLEFAAFNNPELEELGHLDGVNISASGAIEPPVSESDPVLAWRARRRYEIMERLTSRPRVTSNRQIVFQFLATPVGLRGAGRVEGLDYVRNRVMRTGSTITYERSSTVETLDAGLVLSACGYRGAALKGLPFEEAAGIVPNKGGRVIDTDAGLPGTYVTGWIKRGCRGIIGSNRRCAQETVSALIADQKAGLLQPATMSCEQVRALLTARNKRIVQFGNWRSIDRSERQAGQALGRPRVKLAQTDALLEAAFAPQRQAAAIAPGDVGW
jgi:ferredoxin/flavodoxin---NADP+ reductase